MRASPLLTAAFVLAIALAVTVRTAQTMTYVSPCNDPQYLEAVLGAAPLALKPADLTRTACLKPDFPADRIAGAILAPLDTSGVAFAPIDDVVEAPTEALVEMFPEALTRDAIARSEVASNWEADRNTAVHIIRAPGGTLFLLVHDIL